MHINLNAEDLNEMLSKAILSSLDQAKRDMLIQAALQHLVTSSGEAYYGKKQSPIHAAFNWAVQKVAEKLATEMVTENTEVIAQMRGIIDDAVLKVMQDNREETVSRLAKVIAESMWRER